jgi:hypothetical protein
MEKGWRCRVFSSQYRLRGLSHLQAICLLHDCFLRIQPTQTSVCVEARERLQESARSVALHRLIHRSLPQTWPTTPYTAPHPPSRGASREGGT